MSVPLRLLPRVWVIVLACALGFLTWTDFKRIEHVDYVTAVGRQSDVSPAGRNVLIVPEHINESYHWIAQTEQMLETREWKVRHIDYENAPFGRSVIAPSPYRWWLGTVAACWHAISGQSLNRSVERAALISDPLLHLLLLAGTVVFVARRFGAMPAALAAVGMAVSFPFASVFLPGAPDDQSLSQIAALWSVLLLIAGVRSEGLAESGGIRSKQCWFLLAGIAGGIGVWISPACQVPVIGGLAVGGLVSAWIRRGEAAAGADGVESSLPWRTWALGGAATVLTACLIENAPGNLGGWQLRSVHPLYGLAWLGGGEWLGWAAARVEKGKPVRRRRDIAVLAFAAVAVAALPFAMWKTHNHGFLSSDLDAFRLTKLPDGAVAPTFLAWLREVGISPAVWSVILPFTLTGPAVWVLLVRGRSIVSRVQLALAIGPLLAAVGFSCVQLSWWSEADALLIVMLIAATARDERAPRPHRWLWAAAVTATFGLGLSQTLPTSFSKESAYLDEPEVFGLVERDLADWLSLRTPSGGAIFVAPPNETVALSYYGGGRGIGTLSWENREGLEAAVRILSASTPEEARALIERRGVTHIIIPSWDPYLDEYARMGMGQLDGTFLNRLHLWTLPPWLRPVPYRLPVIAGLERQSITIFQVVDDQSPAAAMSRTAEYFIELGQLDQAAVVAQGLRRYPADLGAWTARAEVELALADDAAFSKSLKVILPYITGKRDRSLPWDLRVALSIVLARGKKVEEAREQVRQCYAAIDETKLRSLASGALYRLLFLGRTFGYTIPDEKQRQLALDLLPAEARSRL